jgi:hypothetical protein
MHNLAKAFALFAGMFVAVLVHADILRVKAGADLEHARGGTDWEADATNLQRALQMTESGDEIWVAAGTYYPDEGQGQVDDSRDSVFQVKAGVSLYGGFSGMETNLAERDPDTNLSILSGDINQDESGTSWLPYQPAESILANSYHVLWLEGGSSVTTRVSGFTITAGCARAGDSSSLTYGGGIYSELATAEISDCIFTANYAMRGGAVYLGNSGQPPDSSYGGTRISNCQFENNKGYYGGALYSFYAEPEVVDSQFIDNGYPLSSLNLNGSSIGSGSYWYDYSTLAGAIYSREDDLVLSACLFSGNTAVAVYGYNSSMYVESCRFSGNVTEGGGAAISASGSYGYPSTTVGNIIILNSLFDGNDSEFFGAGALAFSGSLNAYITNSTFTANSGRGTGYGVMYLSLSEMWMANTIIWGNFSGDLLRSDVPQPESSGGETTLVGRSGVNSLWYPTNSIVNVSYSLIAGSAFHLGDTTNLNGRDAGNDIQFAGPNDYRLSASSPAIGVGSNSIDLDGAGPGTLLVEDLPHDLMGEPRVQGSRIDMGAFEFKYIDSYVDTDLDGLPDWFEETHGNNGSTTSMDAKSDLDQDGLSVLEELLFGTDPNQSDQPSYQLGLELFKVYVPIEPSNLVGAIGYTLEDQDFFVGQFKLSRAALPFIRIMPESSTDLSIESGWGTDRLIVFDKSPDEISPEFETFKLRSRDSLQETGKQFFRLRLELK